MDLRAVSIVAAVISVFTLGDLELHTGPSGSTVDPDTTLLRMALEAAAADDDYDSSEAPTQPPANFPPVVILRGHDPSSLAPERTAPDNGFPNRTGSHGLDSPQEESTRLYPVPGHSAPEVGHAELNESSMPDSSHQQPLSSATRTNLTLPSAVVIADEEGSAQMGSSEADLALSAAPTQPPADPSPATPFPGNHTADADASKPERRTSGEGNDYNDYSILDYATEYPVAQAPKEQPFSPIPGNHTGDTDVSVPERRSSGDGDDYNNSTELPDSEVCSRRTIVINQTLPEKDQTGPTPFEVTTAEYYTLLFAWFCYCHSGVWSYYQPMRFFTAGQSYLKLVLYGLANRQELALPLFITYMQGRVKLTMIQMGMLGSWVLIDSLIMIIELLRLPHALEPYGRYTPERIFLALWEGLLAAGVVFYLGRQICSLKGHLKHKWLLKYLALLCWGTVWGIFSVLYWLGLISEMPILAWFMTYATFFTDAAALHEPPPPESSPPLDSVWLRSIRQRRQNNNS